MNENQLKKEWENYSENPNEKTKNKLVEHYRSLVAKIAASLFKKMSNKVTREELESHGLTGLYKAIDKFDLKRKNKFETYATQRIHGSMIDGLRSEDWVPRSVRVRFNKIEKARKQLEMEKSGYISEDEIIEKAGISKEEYHSNIKKYMPTSISSIDSYVGPSSTEGEESIKDCNKYLEDSSEMLPEEKTEKMEFIKKLLDDNFSDAERKIIYYYYYKGMTMKEMSAKINISESRISQIHQRALKKLKNKIKDNIEEFEEIVPGVSKMCSK